MWEDKPALRRGCVDRDNEHNKVALINKVGADNAVVTCFAEPRDSFFQQVYVDIFCRADGEPVVKALVCKIALIVGDDVWDLL